MDPQIEELKELVRRNIAVTEEIKHDVHAMHRSARWARFFRVAWLVLILAVSGAAYYYYIAPYMAAVRELYSSIQTGTQNAQGFGEQFSNFFKNLGGQQ